MALSMMALTSTGSLHTACPLREQFGSSANARTGTPVKMGVRRICPIVCCERTSSEGGHVDPPKLEPFSQSRLSRAMRERSFLRKAEDALNDVEIYTRVLGALISGEISIENSVRTLKVPADGNRENQFFNQDKCMVLEGEEAYECWEALFDYENLKDEAESECSIADPGAREDSCKKLERLENMVRQSGGVNSLIDNVRMMAKIKEANKHKDPPNEQDWLKAVAESATEDAEKQSGSQHHEFLEDGGIPKSEQELQEDLDALLPESAFSRILKRRGPHKE